MSEKLAEIKKHAVPVLKKHNVIEAYIFGSVARGEEHPGSDIDILARSNSTVGLFEFIGTKLDLEDMLGTKVDLVEIGALRPEFRSYVDREKVQIV